MSKAEWMNTLQAILNCSIQINPCSLLQWQEALEAHTDLSTESASNLRLKTTSGEDGKKKSSMSNHKGGIVVPKIGDYIQASSGFYVVQAIHENELAVLMIPRSDISTTEQQLISCIVQQACNDEASDEELVELTETERTALQISDWLLQQLDSSEPAYSLPDHLVMGSRLYAEMIPFLLVMEQSNTTAESRSSFAELDRLLCSFLTDDIILIPLKNKEWLILGPVSLLRDDEEMLEDQEESLEESLASIAHGLNEMLASEWLGDCHLAVAPPISPANSMVETVLMLRETINLGRKFHVGTSIHLPWMLQLERIVNAIPEAQRAKYLEQSLKKGDLFLEAEMLATLEAFFMLDCNVSETAKRLYIHRNTLLYRLDKLKQETGLDVRLFRDAVLVKIILLLYKVTKRN